VPIAERIDCMECGAEAVLVQPVDDETELEAGDILVYRCRECLQRWDVVLDDDDLTD
jgi:hypothetical protein